MTETQAVVFTFDERSLVSSKEMAGQEFTEIVVRDPETQQERVMVIPSHQATGKQGS